MTGQNLLGFLKRVGLMGAVGALVIGLVFFRQDARAALTKYDTETYDLDRLGVPKFVNTLYIDLRKVSGLSKYRSNAGHEYSDSSQFGAEAYKNPADGNRIDACSSMKHYFMAPDASTAIYAPTTGVVSRMFDESIGGKQIQITSSVQPAFTFTMFHVELTKPLAEGDRVVEGEVIGHHVGTQTWSDIAVAVHTPRGYHLVSYFETLTDQAFAPVKARGVASREALSISLEYRRAHPVFSCAGSAPQTPPDADYVPLSGGAARQTISIAVTPPGTAMVGDAPFALSATSTAGLPVTISTREPKVCRFTNGAVSWRRPGTCTIDFSQGGDADTFAALTSTFTVAVGAQGASLLNVRPYLGGIYPPASSGVQSYLRFYNAGSSAGTVTASLINGDTGAVVATWTSRSIVARRTVQVSINDLEAASTSVLTSRPSVYGIRIEDTTTMFGYMQHVLFDAASGGLTNASSCKTGITGAPVAVPFLYSSLFPEYTSTVVLANPSSSDYPFGLDSYRALSGTAVGGTAFFPFIYRELEAVEPHGHYILPVSGIETRFNDKPPVADPIFATQMNTSRYLAGYMQHLVTSKRPNVVADMSAACNLYGSAQTTIASPLFTAHVVSPTPAAGQSLFRFYNAGATANTATVILRDPASGAVLGQGTTPSIAPGEEIQYALDAIENTPGFTKKSLYTAEVETDIDGYFQHVLYRAPDGALSNLSTCSASVTLEEGMLIAVHSSLVGGMGYPSTVIVNNTGEAAAAVTLDLLDARNGRLLTSFTTSAIPAHAQARLDVAAMEKQAGYTPTAGVGHYIVKVRGAFTGYLQHYVTNQAAGVVSDMTSMCAM